MAFFILRYDSYDMEQLFVVVLACAGRVDPHPDMFEPLVFMEHCLDPPGIFKAAKVRRGRETNRPLS